ncbi:hypothetical protein DF13_22905, partial [Salmonella enterica subsp. enterica serovar Reading]
IGVISFFIALIIYIILLFFYSFLEKIIKKIFK